MWPNQFQEVCPMHLLRIWGLMEASGFSESLPVSPHFPQVQALLPSSSGHCLARLGHCLCELSWGTRCQGLGKGSFRYLALTTGGLHEPAPCGFLPGLPWRHAGGCWWPERERSAVFCRDLQPQDQLLDLRGWLTKVMRAWVQLLEGDIVTGESLVFAFCFHNVLTSAKWSRPWGAEGSCSSRQAFPVFKLARSWTSESECCVGRVSPFLEGLAGCRQKVRGEWALSYLCFFF